MRNVVCTYSLLVCGLSLIACGGDEGEAPNSQAGMGAGMTVAGMTAGTGATGGAGGTGATGGAGGTGATGPGIVMGECVRTGPSPEELEPMLESIAMSQGAQRALATPSGLYWFSGTSLKRLGSDGITVSVVAEATANSLATNGTLIAWVGNDGTANGAYGIYSAPLGMDGVTPLLVAEIEGAFGFGLDATHAYYGSLGDALSRIPLPSGEPEVIGPSGISELVVDGGYVYYREQLGSAVKRVPVAGGMSESTRATAGSAIDAMLIDAESVYTSGTYSIDRVSRSNPEDITSLVRFETATGDEDNYVWRMVNAGDKVVFVDGLDNVAWVSKDGSDCGVVRDSPETEVISQPRTNLASDAQYLYLIDLGRDGIKRLDITRL